MPIFHFPIGQHKPIHIKAKDLSILNLYAMARYSIPITSGRHAIQDKDQLINTILSEFKKQHEPPFYIHGELNNKQKHDLLDLYHIALIESINPIPPKLD